LCSGCSPVAQSVRERDQRRALDKKTGTPRQMRRVSYTMNPENRSAPAEARATSGNGTAKSQAARDAAATATDPPSSHDPSADRSCLAPRPSRRGGREPNTCACGPVFRDSLGIRLHRVQAKAPGDGGYLPNRQKNASRMVPCVRRWRELSRRFGPQPTYSAHASPKRDQRNKNRLENRE
jgi:hypothetical protein